VKRYHLLHSPPPLYLSVSSNGSTWVKQQGPVVVIIDEIDTFSILERIDVGETRKQVERPFNLKDLSVSSNGSTWVKPTRIS